MPTVHLPDGGSSAHRKTGCPGWRKKSEGIPPRPSNEAARVGSMHHLIMELCQTNENSPADHLGTVYEEDGHTHTFGEDDLSLSEIAHLAVNNVLDEYDVDTMLVEPFVQLVPGEVGGSIDLLAISADMETAVILDYKFGVAKVPVEESPNLGLYGISARHDPTTADLFAKVKKIVFVIIQPQAKGVTFTWETTPKWLNSFERQYRKALKSDKIKAGTWCKYCPAEPYCEVKRAAALGAKRLNPALVKNLQASADKVQQVESWVKAVKEELYLQLNHSVPIDGWKIIDKRAVRKWTDPDAVYGQVNQHVARKDCYSETLLTPAQLEKVLKSNKVEIDLSEFITCESTGTTLALESHNSPAVIVTDVQGHLKDMMK